MQLNSVYQLNRRILTEFEDSSESHTNSRKWYYQTIHNALSIHWDFTLAVLFDEEFHYTHIGGDFESIYSKGPIYCGWGKMQTQRNITCEDFQAFQFHSHFHSLFQYIQLWMQFERNIDFLLFDNLFAEKNVVPQTAPKKIFITIRW